VRALAVLLLFLATGCKKEDVVPAGATTLEKIRAAGKIRVGYANEAPYAYQDPATGGLTGEAPEVARAVLRDLGEIEMEGVLTEFGSLIPGLKAGRLPRGLVAAGQGRRRGAAQDRAHPRHAHRVVRAQPPGALATGRRCGGR
jgi:polar amino acid transport system substrate-binding protein